MEERPPSPRRAPGRRGNLSRRPVVAGISISNAARVVFRGAGLTKLDLARYYEQVGEAALPHFQDRPLTLVRCGGAVEDGCSYLRHARAWGPAALRRVNIREANKVGEYLVVESVPGLVALAQMDAVEGHTWNSRAADVDRPDRLVFDLDPGPEVRRAEVARAARRVRALLEAVGLRSWAKTTGGAGLHVVAPIVPERSWDECLLFARGVAETLARDDPARLTTRYAKAGRERLILIDYLRNNRTNTSIAAFSPRAREGAPVSVPISWDELSPRLDPLRFTVRTVPARLRRLRANPWAGYFRCRQRLRL